WRQPPWMTEAEYKSLLETRGLHGAVIAMSTENYQRACSQDLWMRFVLGCFAGLSVGGIGLAYRNIAKTSELQMRLVRASELNNHLKEMNLAAAGLAHETRNPLNIIRGLAQLVSKQDDAAPEIRKRLREIVDETDRVTAQLNEFINYSRPREVRRSVVTLGSVISEVARALSYDVEEKQIRLETSVNGLVIEADEQLLRQCLFNLLLNATQAVGEHGEIRVVASKGETNDAMIEVIDDGPGVPEHQQKEIFKPYFTTHEKGTGLGLAIVQQIVLAHGWEIHYEPNEPKGAIFRLTHLKVVHKS
ncbi:MAG: putative Histidine kinase, partial [Verrucomicrobiales bacterium]|nr:putative Histidine kinase [Verrucomicrobiales bacterium]